MMESSSGALEVDLVATVGGFEVSSLPFMLTVHGVEC